VVLAVHAHAALANIGSINMFDSYKWIKAFKRSRIINRIHEADTNIFSADDEQPWPSGPFGKKDDYADEAGSSYKRAKDWQIDKPGEDEDTEGTGYKEDQT
jgi:hypothetical protein